MLACERSSRHDATKRLALSAHAVIGTPKGGSRPLRSCLKGSRHDENFDSGWYNEDMSGAQDCRKEKGLESCIVCLLRGVMYPRVP